MTVFSKPQSPCTESMCLETERGSGRHDHLQPVSVAHSPGPSPETPDVPSLRAEFFQVNLDAWYPRYLACLRHFLEEGQHTVAVQSLAAFVNIRLPYQRLPEPVNHFAGPSNGSSHLSLRPYIQRLIVTGNDMPAVLEAFFGGDWLAGVGSIWKQERLNYLFTAKSSGWASTKSAYDILPDEQTPFLRPLRGPSEDELRMAESRWSEWLAMEDWMVGPRSPW
ncbi:hypothetical protein ARAM_003061 [Aspergillus rambellii]|uniref:Ilp is an apoptosis inhibitor n=2 Tax=Aspergillus subgen. Nidulantes TaxID=2720870 RepID=A0A0F8V3F3_9EURO|nr:hypothetical protein AOCH_007346 [Aspergillus ochraceoroseus]KKK26293.1 hypothetical protein ARAM_003061 [Aspergillus rambellii]